MSDKGKLDLLCKEYKEKQKALNRENTVKQKWAAMSLTCSQKKNRDFGNRLYF